MPAKYGGFSPYISEKNLTKMSRKLLNVAPHIKKSATADLTVELEVLQAELTVAVFCRNDPSDNTFT